MSIEMRHFAKQKCGDKQFMFMIKSNVYEKAYCIAHINSFRLRIPI